MPGALRIVVVGGVAGGASAAARARRLSDTAEIIVFERGPHVSFANCGLPYHLGGVIEDRSKLLLQTPETLGARYDLDVRVNTEVVAIDPEAQVVVARHRRTGKETRQPYDALVLSPGAEPVRPALPGMALDRVFTLRNLVDLDAIMAAARSGAGRALVVGAGFIGLELAEQFRQRGLAVTLVERLPQVLGPADPEMTVPLQEALARHGVDLRLGRQVAAFEPGPDGLTALLDDGERIPCALAVLGVGVRPETQLARAAGLAIGATGGILVDERMRTSRPGIYAVGDAVEVQDFVSQGPAYLPLAGPANRQGRIAADAIFGRDTCYRASQGTAICKVFDLACALTGLSETALRRKSLPYRRVYLFPPDHAGYYPGSQLIAMKLLFEPGSGRILGAQAVGGAGVDKRIDVIATAQRAGLTVFDLEDLELCYAPPYGSAKDPVNLAGFVAANVLRGDVDLWEPEELAGLGEGQVLVDVRTFQEHAQETIPGALCAPVDELRERLDELPRDKELLLFCRSGMRSYVAARLLAQRGYRVRHLSGGWLRYAMWRGSRTGDAGSGRLEPCRLPIPTTPSCAT